MLDSLTDITRRDYWHGWGRIEAKTLIVRGQEGSLTDTTVAEMGQRLPSAATKTIADAGHDLHLDNPDGWRAAMQPFVRANARSERG